MQDSNIRAPDFEVGTFSRSEGSSKVEPGFKAKVAVLIRPARKAQKVMTDHDSTGGSGLLNSSEQNPVVMQAFGEKANSTRHPIQPWSSGVVRSLSRSG